MKTRFGGIWPAMVTPTTSDGRPALDVCERLVDLFVGQGLGGIYLVGSTGQWPLFSVEERKAIAERVVKAAAGRLPVMVHVGAVTTADAVALAGHAARIGADAVSAVGPIYYAHSPDAVFEYYGRIASATDRPLFAYHLSGVNKLPLGPREYAERLLAIPNISGMKITDHDLYPFGLIHALAGDRLQLFSGADEVMCHAVLSGAVGAIGSFYNLWGESCAQRSPGNCVGRHRDGPRLHAPLPDGDRRYSGRGRHVVFHARRDALQVRPRHRHAPPATGSHRLQMVRCRRRTDRGAGGWSTSPRLRLATNDHIPRGDKNMRRRTTLAAAAMLAAGALLQAQQPSGVVIPVTAENFARAESDRYFAAAVKKGGFGKYYHSREPTPIDKQSVIRMNRDTLYSSGVFDLDAGPVTITLPEAGKRFLSMQVIDEDHYTHAVVYGAGKHTLSKEKIGTRYVAAPVRILVDPANPRDVEEVHKLQDAIKVEQAGAGKFEVPNWDPASQKKVRDALLVLGATIPDTKRMFGAKDQVDPVRHLIGSAMAWGGNPERDAFYLNVTPPHNDGKTSYRLTVKEVPVDAFWSISVYNAKGYFEPNKENAYTLNNLTAKKNDDGSVTVQFGGCDGKTPNCLPIVPGWNFIVRLYRPRKEILDGTWKFPEAQPVK